MPQSWFHSADWHWWTKPVPGEACQTCGSGIIGGVDVVAFRVSEKRIEARSSQQTRTRQQSGQEWERRPDTPIPAQKGGARC